MTTQIICNVAKTGKKLDVTVKNGKFFVMGHEIFVWDVQGKPVIQLRMSVNHTFSLVGNIEDSVFAEAYSAFLAKKEAEKSIKGIHVANGKAAYSDRAALKEMGIGL